MDSGAYGQVGYRITNVFKGASHFSVRPSGAIVLRFPVNRQRIALHMFSVAASDTGIDGNFSSSVNVTVLIIDSKPKFQKSTYEATVDENTPVGTEVMNVVADVSAAVKGAKLTYHLVSNLPRISSQPVINKYLNIHPLTGVISIKGKYYMPWRRV